MIMTAATTMSKAAVSLMHLNRVKTATNRLKNTTKRVKNATKRVKNTTKRVKNATKRVKNTTKRVKNATTTNRVKMETDGRSGGPRKPPKHLLPLKPGNTWHLKSWSKTKA